jgi:tripartite-type tricarboxylate transporter receptor subunit TctC
MKTKLLRRDSLRLAAGAAILLVASQVAMPQAYPTRPLTLNVPFPAGGPTDVIGRIVAERMRASLGQPIIIENVAGASGSIGVGRVARATPDGYTLGIGTLATHVLNGAAYTLQYDLLRDFEPVALLSTSPSVIVAKSTMPARNLRELVDWLKANPDKALMATVGAGGVGHVNGAFFQRETGARIQFVFYRGVGPALQDLVAGQIAFMIDSPTNSLPQVRSGTIKAYAVTGAKRLAAAPDIPTVDEAGLPGLHTSNWHGLWVPRGTPADIVAKLNTAVVVSLADPAVRARLAELGQEIFQREQQTPEALGAHQRAEIDKWWPVIKAAGIKAE